MKPVRLQPERLEITEAVIAAYADVTGDRNPIHLDDSAAQLIGLERRIAHGMIGGAVLSRMMARNLGELWATCGRLDVAFVKPVHVGETVTAIGEWDNAAGAYLVQVGVEGAVVIVGEAWLDE
jgi:3-hydroxybutyryl-CoA dehydratase